MGRSFSVHLTTERSDPANTNELRAIFQGGLPAHEAFAWGMLVDFSSEPLALSFVNADASKHEILLGGVTGHPGVVQVKKVHKENAAEWV
jgi:hypothetical protein